MLKRIHVCMYVVCMYILMYTLCIFKSATTSGSECSLKFLHLFFCGFENLLLCFLVYAKKFPLKNINNYYNLRFSKYYWDF